MQIAIINLQSVSDVITNSSTEVFIANTDKTVEQVNNILGAFTSGFQYPEIFSLEKYREYLKSERGTCSYSEDIYAVAKGWFYDLEDEKALHDYRVDHIKYLQSQELVQVDGQYQFMDNLLYDIWEDFQNEKCERIADYDIASWRQLSQSDRSKHLREKDNLKAANIEAFLKTRGPEDSWWFPDEKRTVQYLNGKIIILGDSDNSIPYDDWEKIEDLFNTYNIHLG